jgi:hypothetical protein
MARAIEVPPELRPFVVAHGDFALGRSVGSGAFAEVFKATDRRTGAECAVKRLLQADLDGRALLSFIREVGVLSKCNHRFLTAFLGFTAAPPFYLVTQFVPNGTLFQFVRRRAGARALTPTQKTLIAVGIADGMRHLHSFGIIHRDLKSLNILLDENFLPAICDFGISRFLDAAADEEAAVMTKDIGTPHWMAPELFTSHQYTNKVDVYAYAVLLWEMQTEAPPFRGKTVMQIGIGVSRRGERPELPNDVPVKLRELIVACWAQNPDDRPSFDDIVRAFVSDRIMYEGSSGDEVQAFLERLGGESATFETEFHRSVAALSEQNCGEFFGGIAALLNEGASPAVAAFVLRELCPVIERSSAFFTAFVTARIVDLLPALRDSAPGPLFELLQRVIAICPVLLTKPLLMDLAPLISTGYAAATIVLLAPVLRSFDQMPNGWVASDHLITCGSAFIANSPLLYVNTILSMLSTFPTYREARFCYIAHILIEGLSSPDLEAVCVIYSIFVTFYRPELVFDAAFLLRDLQRSEVVDSVLSFLIVQTSIFLTVEIVNYLLSLLPTKSSAFAGLAAACESEVGGCEALLAIGGSWIVDKRLSLTQVLALLGKIVARREARSIVAEFPELFEFFDRVMRDGDAQLIAGLAIVVARLPTSIKLFERLTAMGFFAIFFPAVRRSQDELVVRSGVCIVDAFSRIVFDREFLTIVPVLMAWLVAPDEGKAVRALSALASLVGHEEGLRTITSVGFDVRWLDRFRQNPHYHVYLEAFGIAVN